MSDAVQHSAGTSLLDHDAQTGVGVLAAFAGAGVDDGVFVYFDAEGGVGYFSPP